VDTIHWILIGLLCTTFLVLLRTILKQSSLKYSLCCYRRSLCGPGRLKFLAALREAAGREREVLTWVPLNILLDPDEPRKGKELQHWLDERWLDFLIVEKKFYRPLLAVQFNRQREEDPFYQPGRDEQLELVMKNAGLPLLWLPSEDYQHVELLRHAMEQLVAKETVLVGDTSSV